MQSRSQSAIQPDFPIGAAAVAICLSYPLTQRSAFSLSKVSSAIRNQRFQQLLPFSPRVLLLALGAHLLCIENYPEIKPLAAGEGGWIVDTVPNGPLQ